jgi:hypothetical protein
VVDGATHGDLLLEESAAAAVTDAILDVVSAIRDDRALAR